MFSQTHDNKTVMLNILLCYKVLLDLWLIVVIITLILNLRITLIFEIRGV